MALIKNTRLLIALCAVIFICGLGLGLLVNNLPYISFKEEVDVGTGIAILGLVVTIFIMPFIVQRQLSRQDNINSVILNDIDAIHSSVVQLREIFVDLKPSTRITNAKYRVIIASFKTVSAAILALNKELEARHLLQKFKSEVYDQAYNHAYETCTEPLSINKKLDEVTIFEANKALNGLCTELKKYRYETFA